MALSIKHPEADRLARELAATTGELTDAIINALKERLRRERGCSAGTSAAGRTAGNPGSPAALPIRDGRSPDEIGYDERGVPR